MTGTSVELPITNTGVQMGNRWQTAKINQILGSTNQTTKNLENLLSDNSHLIERYVLTLTKT